MKIYTLVGGVNGVGKSSLTGVLSAEHDDLGIIIDTDSITAKNENNKILGGKIAISYINDALEKGINFTQETTLSEVRTLKTIKSAKERGYKIRLYYVAISSADDSLLRIENRVRKGGHNIPAEDVIRRFEKRFDDLNIILPYCDEVHFYDNENGFVEVGQYRNGKFYTNTQEIPDWYNKLIVNKERSLQMTFITQISKKHCIVDSNDDDDDDPDNNTLDLTQSSSRGR